MTKLSFPEHVAGTDSRGRAFWSFEIAGRTYRALYVSAATIERFDRFRERERSPLLNRIMLRAVLRQVFPWLPSYLVRGDPAKLVRELTPAARAQCLAEILSHTITD